MLPDGFVIRRATAEDAGPLAAFAAESFHDAFGADNAPEDMSAYLTATYGERQQRAECIDRDIVTLLVEHESRLVGFAQVRRGDAPACVTFPRPVEVWRFYVARAWHGRGVAPELMRAALAGARELGGGSAWLSVWERNPRAQAFYAKCGFHDVGSTVFVVGSDRQTDRVMARPLDLSSAV